MRVTRRSLLFSSAVAALPTSAARIAPYGAVPSPRQMEWHRMEFYGFLHFTVNTFTDREWGYGDESPSLFNPAQFDPAQIIGTLKLAGMKGVILTAKHHDGFCLWPTKTTSHSIAACDWRGGKGDVVGDLAREAGQQGLKFGVYLSPWDRNSALYGGSDYPGLYRRQLEELLTRYGPIFEVWHDGANGGDGYYGGARERRTIDKKTYYGWPETWALVRNLQPGACIFSDAGPDIRWVGNERGIAPETCWATCDPIGEKGGEASPGDADTKTLGTGTRGGKRWLPAECDVSIRPGWFWHEKENGRVKTPQQLMDLYLQSVGRGASFLLNVPPDPRGLIHETDAASLGAFGKTLRSTFGENLAEGAEVSSPATRPGANPSKILSAAAGECWASPESNTAPEITISLRAPKTFDLISISEALEYGQRIEGVGVDVRRGEAWVEAATATSIGSRRLMRLSAPVETSAVRLRVTASAAAPALRGFGLYRMAG